MMNFSASFCPLLGAQSCNVKRRKFVRLLGGVAASAALFSWSARAQATAALPVVGFLHAGSPEQNVARLAAFLKGLREAGYVVGQPAMRGRTESGIDHFEGLQAPGAGTS